MVVMIVVVVTVVVMMDIQRRHEHLQEDTGCTDILSIDVGNVVMVCCDGVL